jgi:PAS domain S-box-containing protein
MQALIKTAEDALKKSDEKFSKAFHSSPQAMAITNLEDGRLIEINDSFTNVLGHDQEESIGYNTSELGIWVNPEDRKRFMKNLSENEFVRNVEVNLKTKAGKTITMVVSAELINSILNAIKQETGFESVGIRP